MVKVNNLAGQKSAGYTSRAPKWATAYKYPPEVVRTKLLNIEVGVGKTGRITPYAVLQPVHIGGSVVSLATLHNFHEIKRKNLLIGDTIFLRKAGEIIPEIISSVVVERTGTETVFTPPITCPSCDTPLGVEKDNDQDIRCLNTQSCTAQLEEKLIYIGSRKVLHIEGLGEKTAQALVGSETVTRLADLFHLTETQLKTVPFFTTQSGKNVGEVTKSAQTFLTSLNEAKSKPFWRILTSLNIRHIGPSTAQEIVKQLPTMDALMTAAANSNFPLIKGVGNEVTQSMQDWFADENNIYTVNRWKEAGVNMGELDSLTQKQSHPTYNTSHFLHGKKVTITGSFSPLSRDDVIEILHHMGATFTSTLSKKTDYLLAGDKPGSKLVKAQQLGVSIITELPHPPQ